MTLLLAVACLLIFSTFQYADQKKAALADTFYLQQLLPLEWPYYETHLLKQNEKAHFEALNQAYQHRQLKVVAERMGADESFAASLVEDGKSFMDDATYSRWMQGRQIYDPLRDSLSTFALGIDPEKSRPITYVTSLFLHPGWMILALNCLFILMLGLPLENESGASRLLFGFLLCGVVGGLTHNMMIRHEVFPLIGASSAVAGMTGAYLFRFRQHMVTYTWAQWKIILPGPILPALWLVKEGIEYVYSASPSMNPLAHALALASGALYWFAMQRSFPPLSEPLSAKAEDAGEEEQALRIELGEALNAMANISFKDARERLQTLVQQRPNELSILIPLYHVLKLDPASIELQTLVRQIFNRTSMADAELRQILAVYRDYDQLPGDKSALDLETSLRLVLKFTRLEALKEAEKMMQHARGFNQPHMLLGKSAAALAQAFEKLQDSNRAKQYQQLADDNRTLA